MKPTYAEIAVSEETSLSEAIVLGIAEQKEIPPPEMPPLYETIDPEALDTLFRDRDSGHLSFEYAGYTVVIRGREPIVIHGTEDQIQQTQDEGTNGGSPLRIVCSACGWEATATGTDDHVDVSRRAIDHFTDTGHTPVRKVGEISV
ncbi:HalOD1 output domain-containing protein [Halopiger thermotolerans]